MTNAGPGAITLWTQQVVDTTSQKFISFGYVLLDVGYTGAQR
jgi:hypothetical protein